DAPNPPRFWSRSQARSANHLTVPRTSTPCRRLRGYTRSRSAPADPALGAPADSLPRSTAWVVRPCTRQAAADRTAVCSPPALVPCCRRMPHPVQAECTTSACARASTHFFHGATDRLIGNRIDDLQFDQPRRQQTQGPACPTLRRLRAGEFH